MNKFRRYWLKRTNDAANRESSWLRFLRTARYTALLAAFSALAIAGDGPNVTADLVLGQPDFTTSGFGTTVSNINLALPYGVALDSSVIPNHLYIADTADNRVLGWDSVSALTNGAPADLVIGQVDFNSSVDDSDSVNASGLSMPWSVAVDSNGNLYIADNGDNRVLEYNTPFEAFGHPCNTTMPCEGGLAANLVLGQGNAGSSFGTRKGCVGSVDTSCFDEPSGIWIDKNNNLYVADTINNRVVIFLNPLGSSGKCVGAKSNSGCAGDVVADYSLGECTGNEGFLDAEGDCSRPKVTMLGPNAVGVDSQGNVFAADTEDNRVLEFDNPVGSSNLAANRVYGKDSSGSNFDVADCANGQGADPGPSATSMCYPSGVALDSQDNLYIADYGNSRIMLFNKPLNNFTADLIFGQGSTGSDFTDGVCYGGQPPNMNQPASASGMCSPGGMSLDSTDNLFAADTGNSRMLEFTNTGITPTSIPTATATESSTPNPSATATLTPTATPTATPTPVMEKLTVSPTTLKFGEVPVNTTSGAKTITITNAGKKKSGHPVVVSTESTSDPAFTVTDECIETLAPGKSCKVKVTFSPDAAATKQTAILTINTNLVDAPPTVKLRGTGKAAKK